MYTRPRQPHEPIPSISTIPYPPPSHLITKSEDLTTWYSSPEPLLRPEPSPPLLPSPTYHHHLPPFVPPPFHQLRTLTSPPPPVPSPPLAPPLAPSLAPRPIPPLVTTDSPNPHLPAEKDAALKAAKLAKECKDRGPHSAKRFNCTFPACHKHFQRRYNLKVHLRKHTRETPYTCSHPGCGKKFRWRSSMSHHLKAHKKRAASHGITATMSVTTPSSRESCNDAKHETGLLPVPHNLLASSSVSYKSGEPVAGIRGDDSARRGTHGRLLPTSPISSGTNERFAGFGLEHVGLAAGCDVGMEELNFHGEHEHVTGMMFDNMM